MRQSILERQAYTAGWEHKRWDSVCSSDTRHEQVDWVRIMDAYYAGVRAGMARDELQHSTR